MEIKWDALRFAHDSVLLFVSDQPLTAKLKALNELTRVALKSNTSGRRKHSVDISSKRVTYLDRRSLYYAYRDIFVRESYLFHPTHTAPLILDCGANIGLATLYFKLLWPDSEILAFEPDRPTFAVLEKNIADNSLKGVTAYNVALWDKDETIDFFVDQARPGMLLMSAQRERAGGQRTTVVARRLSVFIGTRSVDFLKLDVEGAEDRVLMELASAGKLGLIKSMAIEYHHGKNSQSRLGKFLQVLEDNGFQYRISAAWSPRRQPAAVQDVMIFAKKC
jgi:FkbM family methyltransferase